MSPPSELLPSQYPSAYQPTSQHTLVSSRPHPAAFPTPQVQSNHAPAAHFGRPPVPPRVSSNRSDSPPPGVRRSVTMPTPGLHSHNQVVHGHYPNDALQVPIISPPQQYSGMSGATRPPTNRRRNRACGPYILI